MTTDAFPDRKYDGFIKEISPEANRQKATVQIKVKIAQARRVPAPRNERQRRLPLGREAGRGGRSVGEAVVLIPAAAVKDGAVFVVLDGKAVRRAVKTGAVSSAGDSDRGGTDRRRRLIVNPPPD